MGILSGLKRGYGSAKNAYGGAKTAVNTGKQKVRPIVQKVVQNPVARKVGAGVGLMAGLAARGQRMAAGGMERSRSALILLFPLALVFIDFILGLNGISLDFLFNNPEILSQSIIRIITSVPYWTFLIVYMILRWPHNIKERLFAGVLFLIGFLILAFGGLNIWIFFHLAFAALVFVFLLNGFSSETEINREHWIFILIMVIDIFGLATLKALNASLMGNVIPPLLLNRILFPFWFFYSLFFVKEGLAKKTIIISLVFLYGGYVGIEVLGVPQLDLQNLDIEKTDALKAPGKAIGTWTDVFSSWLSGQIQYAITGKVEENEYEPLGVYLENVQAADLKYDETDDVVIWGTVKARTLDKEIPITVGCYVKDKEGKEKEMERIKEYIDPPEKFTVFTFEEQDFSCTFPSAKEGDFLKTGTNTITTYADFNFPTLAYLKTYFMDDERRKAMLREEIDIFDEFDIQDKTPVAVYTNGPIEIGMETTPLIGVSDKESPRYPTLSISLQNRPGWEGELKEITKFILLLPKYVALVDPQNDCNKEFKNDESACKNELCEGPEGEECKELCDSFEGYSLIITKQNENDQIDFEETTFFRCKLKTTSAILENTPITTKFFRVRAEYNYRVKKPITVNIEKLPDELKETPDTPTNGVPPPEGD
ncbi:MAG: hypothetical protein V1831_04455 [Candidatus Woesearchaeota archaeon]